MYVCMYVYMYVCKRNYQNYGYISLGNARLSQDAVVVNGFQLFSRACVSRAFRLHFTTRDVQYELRGVFQPVIQVTHGFLREIRHHFLRRAEVDQLPRAEQDNLIE